MKNVERHKYITRKNGTKYRQEERKDKRRKQRTKEQITKEDSEVVK